MLVVADKEDPSNVDVDKDDLIFQELEESLEKEGDSISRAYTRKRLQEFQQEYKTCRNVSSHENHGGILHTAQKDSEILNWTTTYPKVIVHFFHPDYKTCQMLDEHLKKLSTHYPKIRWARISVLEAPFLVAKLKIQVLPCVDTFINGIKLDRIVGFDDLGGNEKFSTRTLQARLARSGIFNESSSPVYANATNDSDDEGNSSEEN